jgi:NADH-quinone oxidoreductase subunit J
VIESVLFTAACGLAITGALGAALVRNLFHAALLLGLCLLGTAGLYLFLQQYYLACLQVVVYLGGILVLVLFATLFSSDVMGRRQRPPLLQVAVGGLAALLAGGLALRLGGAVLANGRDVVAAAGGDAIAAEHGAIGDLLLGPWLGPFLLAGFLLTVALVAAVATVRRFRPVGGARG